MADTSGRMSALPDVDNRTAAALDQALGEDVAADEDFAYAIGVLARQRDEARAEVERLRGFAQKVLDAGPEDFTDATLYEWLCDLHDEAAALLDDREETE